ncbi:MAG: glycosyltransferase family 4 protein [Methylophilaceae bacterium]
MKIINVSDFPVEWCWLKKELKVLNLESVHYGSRSIKSPKLSPKRDSINRAVNAFKAVRETKRSPSILVSHAPRSTYYCSNWAKRLSPDTPHLAYSFNFTDLPTGFQRKSMAKAFKQPTRFVTFSTDERKLYADYFDMPIELIDMQYWSVNAPTIDLDSPPVETGDYICALGSQARDYKTLLLAMKKLKHIKLVVVATEENMKGLEVPENVTVYSNIPYAKAFNILTHSQFMVLPLRDSVVPCGHGSIVSAMFHKKAIIITDSSGVYDYIKNEETGLFYEALNADDLSQKIAYMWEDPIRLKKLSDASYQFAHDNCSERAAVDYFSNFLETIK